MTSRFEDKFNRVDGDIGPNYLTACGGVQITDEAVVPIDATQVESGLSPIFGDGVTAMKTQVFYIGEGMDGPDYVTRSVWAHDDIDPDPTTNTAPSFTILARMTKDPLLYDLGTDEEPACFDQGYGARVTCPLDGTAPILTIVKFSPKRRIPALDKAASTQVDGAIVLASAVLDTDDLNIDPLFSADGYVEGTTLLPYKGFWQDMRLRIRRSESEVILEVYLNDRNLNQPKLTHTDKRDPLWGIIGFPGFEFLSATLSIQPSGVSPHSLAGLSVLRCGHFQAETFRDVRAPVSVTPGAEHTYTRIVNRVITLVERGGDARYNSSTSTGTKFDTYLQFVTEAESDIIRKKGFWEWMKRTQRIYLIDGLDLYEMPEDFGEMLQVRPGNWQAPPFGHLDPHLFAQRLGGAGSTSGRPSIYTQGPTGTNSRPQIKLFPVPITPAGNQPGEEDGYFEVDYYARQLFPSEPDIQIPFVPQQHADVLIYGAAAHALLLDTDDANSQRFSAAYAAKLAALDRADFRRGDQERPRMRSAADVFGGTSRARSPITRATQLENFLL